MLGQFLDRTIRRIVSVTAAVAILGSAAWFVWAFMSERAVTEWLDARAAEGWLVNHEDLSVTGYPLISGRNWWRWSLATLRPMSSGRLPELTLEQQAVRPRPHPRHLARGAKPVFAVERLTIEAAAMTSELDVQPAADFALDASDTVLTDVTVTSDAGWRMALPEGRLSMIRQEGQDARYDVDFTARDLAPPVPTRRQLDPGGILPETIGNARPIQRRWNSIDHGTCVRSRIGARRSPRSTCAR